MFNFIKNYQIAFNPHQYTYLFLSLVLQTLYKTQVKELKEEIEEKNEEHLKKIQELQSEKYVHFTLEQESVLQQRFLNF